MIGWVLGFLVGLCILALRVVGVVFLRALYLHEFAHKQMASLLGVEYRDLGFAWGSNVYRVELEDPTPRQVFLISLAPFSLSVLSVSLFVVAIRFWSSSWLLSLFVFVPAVAIGSHSLPSLQDSISAFGCRSWSQPFASFLSSVVVLPLLFIRVLSLFLPQGILLTGLCWAGVLLYISLELFNVTSRWGLLT